MIEKVYGRGLQEQNLKITKSPFPKYRWQTLGLIPVNRSEK
jgi:hypothetical protein